MHQLPWWAIFLLSFLFFLVLGIIGYIVYRGQPCVLCQTCMRCCRRWCRPGPPRLHPPEFGIANTNSPPLSHGYTATFPRTSPSRAASTIDVTMDILVPISAVIPADAETPTISFDVPESSRPMQSPQYIRFPLSQFEPHPTPHPRCHQQVNLDTAALSGDNRAPVPIESDVNEVESPV